MQVLAAENLHPEKADTRSDLLIAHIVAAQVSTQAHTIHKTHTTHNTC